MASIINLELLESIRPVITTLLIFAITYGIIAKSDIITDKRVVAIIAFAAAFFSLFSQIAQNIVGAAIPVLIILGVLFLVFLVLSEFIGIKRDTAIEALGGKGAIWYIIIPLIIIILVIAFSGGNEDDESEDDSSGEENSFLTILRSPVVLGFLLLMLVSVFAIAFLATAPGTGK